MQFAATWINLEIIILNDMSEKNIISLICGIWKNDANELIKKNKQTNRPANIENKFMVRKMGRDKLGGLTYTQYYT